MKGDMEAGEHITVRKLGGAVTVEEYLQSMEDAGITYWNAEELKRSIRRRNGGRTIYRSASATLIR